MKKKANIYDADDVERSKRLNFTPEERAARAEHKAEVLGTKLEKAKKKVPKKKKLRLQKELDPEKSKLKHTLRFEEVEKKRGQEALPKKAGRRMVQSASATVHSKIHQVEEENVGTKAAHRTELASEGAAALASHEIRKYRQNAPYKRVEKLEAQVNRANVSAAYRAAVRDNPELQENTVKRLIQKQRIKHQYAKEFRKAKQAEKQGSAFVQKAKDMFGSIGQTVATAVQEHKGGLVMAGAIAMLIIMVFSSLSSCSVMMDGAMSAVLGTSYTSEDPDIIQTEANYTALETALQNELANIERTHPGYDEYRYDVDSIGHNPNELISYLTAKFDAFTPAQVQAELESMFDRQYSLTTREVVEIRTRTVTSTDPETGETTEDEEEYEYYILYVTLRNKGFGAVALENLDEEQKERYTATLSLKGNKIDLIMAELKRKYPNLTNYRWHAIKLLEQDKEISERYPVSLPDVIDRNYESDIINEKYDFIQEIIREVLVNKDRQDALTEKVDRALTHRVWGIPIFLGIMAVVFFLTFTIGDWLKGYFEMGIESLSALLSDGLVAAGVNEMLRSLLVDGIVAGVGGILTFLPNIFILFLALAFLEDSGYMARVAYVMEGIMSKLGLSGRAFIPMILGFGCTVPAIMASRALENRRDRFKVMLITPFMSCSARLPIYILFAEMFFQEHAMLVAYSMYLIGLLVAILVAAVIHLIDRRKSENYLLIELPEYKIPSSRTVAIYVWEKVKDYLTKAGTTIFVASILMWVILNFGPQGYTTEMADSFGAILGHWLVPFFAPIGLGFWQIAVALIAGISAKEVVVSSCAVLFGVPNINSGAGMDTLVGILSASGFGQLNAFCLMVFCLLYIPCAAALATIRKESGSTRWMLLSALFQLVVAWVVTFIVYRIGLFI